MCRTLVSSWSPIASTSLGRLLKCSARTSGRTDDEGEGDTAEERATGEMSGLETQRENGSGDAERGGDKDRDRPRPLGVGGEEALR